MPYEMKATLLIQFSTAKSRAGGQRRVCLSGWESQNSMVPPLMIIHLVTKTVPDVPKYGVEPFDFIVVTTKNIPDVPPSVADLIAPAVTPGKTVIVLSQNGINIEKPLIIRYPTNPLVSSVAYIGATETAPGNILFDDRDVQKIGAFESPAVPANVASDAAMRYVKIYNPQGELEVSYEPNVAKARWRKLAYNASFNPVAAILRMDTSRIKLSGHIIEDLILPIVHEIRAAAKANNIEMTQDLADEVVSQDPINSPFKPSMLQDIERNNLMEIENILGEPLREGEARGVPMPTLRLVYGVMKGLQLGVREARGLWKPDLEKTCVET